MWFYIILAIVFYLIYKLRIKPYLDCQFYKKQGLPAFFKLPFGYPVLLRDDEMQHNDRYYSQKQLIKEQPDMKAYIINYGTSMGLQLVDPVVCQEFLARNNTDLYFKPDYFFHPQKLGSPYLLSMSPINYWKKHRKAVSIVFHYDFLRKMVPIMSNVSKTILQNQYKTQPKNVNAMDLMSRLTGDVIGHLFFGDDFGNWEVDGIPLSTHTQRLFTTSFKISAHPLNMLFGKKLLDSQLLPICKEYTENTKKNLAVQEQILKKRFEQIKQEKEAGTYNPITKSLVDLFYEKNQETDNPDEKFNETEIISLSRSFFNAGTDTSAITVRTMIFAYLSQPKYQERIHEEIRQFAPEIDITDIDQIQKMEFLNAFFKEAMRLYATAPGLLVREAARDHEIAGIKVKKGSILNIPLRVNFFNPKYFEEPEVFKAERWLDKESLTYQTEKKYPYVFIPFSAGPRNCIGQHMATVETKVIFVQFLKMFPNFKITDPELLKEPYYNDTMNDKFFFDLE